MKTDILSSEMLALMADEAEEIDMDEILSFFFSNTLILGLSYNFNNHWEYQQLLIMWVISLGITMLEIKTEVTYSN